MPLKTTPQSLKRRDLEAVSTKLNTTIMKAFATALLITAAQATALESTPSHYSSHGHSHTVTKPVTTYEKKYKTVYDTVQETVIDKVPRKVTETVPRQVTKVVPREVTTQREETVYDTEYKTVYDKVPKVITETVPKTVIE